ncbi:MAG TPA: hypothetical protein VMM36_07170 [Opitutaceae bacterium]|nr:hypothetical protein [Opitutaceae bacterium]
MPLKNLTLAFAAFLVAASIAQASKDSIVTSVYSKVSNGYTRKLAADGTPKIEYYAIAPGKYLQGLGGDKTIDSVEFPVIAGTVAQFLAKRNYHFAENAKSADLLLMITWGTTKPQSNGTYRLGVDNLTARINSSAIATAAAQGSGRSMDGIGSPESAIADAARGELESALLQMQMFETMRMRANEENARLLGYVEEINDRDNASRFAGGGTYYNDLISDIENERYFVIIAAFDFKAIARDKKERLLWATRVSIQKQGSQFDKDLATMLAQASRYFGKDSGRLIRQYQEGTVTLGEMEVVGVVPDSAVTRGEKSSNE